MATGARLLQVLKTSSKRMPEHLHPSTQWASLASSHVTSLADATQPSAPSGNPVPSSTPLPAGEEPLRQDLTPLLQKWCGKVLSQSNGDQQLSVAHAQPPLPSHKWCTTIPPQGHPAEGALYPEAYPAQHFPAPALPHRSKHDQATTAAMRLVEELSRSAGQLTLACPQRHKPSPEDPATFFNSSSQHPSSLPKQPHGPVQFENPSGPNSTFGHHRNYYTTMYGPYGGGIAAGVRCIPSSSADTWTPECSGSADANASPTTQPRATSYTLLGEHGLSGGGSSGLQDRASGKKLRRLMSNRASAKRSRKRRQDRLEELEIMSVKLKVEQAEHQTKLTESQRQLQAYEEQNLKLKRTLNELREKVSEHLRGGASPLPKRRRSGPSTSRDDGSPLQGANLVLTAAVEERARTQVESDVSKKLTTNGRAEGQDAATQLQEFFSFLGCELPIQPL